MAVVLWFLVWGSSTGEPKVTVRAAANRPAGQRAGQERKWVASIVWLLAKWPFQPAQCGTRQKAVQTASFSGCLCKDEAVYILRWGSRDV